MPTDFMTLEAKLLRLRAAFPKDYDVSVGPVKGSQTFACQVDNDFGESVVVGNGATVEEAINNALLDMEDYLKGTQ